MMKLKLQYIGHLMQTTDSVETSLILGRVGGRRRRGHQRMRWLVGITIATDMNLGILQEMVRDREAWCACSPWGCKELDTTVQLNNMFSTVLGLIPRRTIVGFYYKEQV